MPKSNSDADENDSLTSDDEAVGPTTGRVNPEDVQPAASRPSYTNGDRMATEDVIEEGSSNRLRPPERPIAKFRSSVNKVCCGLGMNVRADDGSNNRLYP
jgi:hypothetical protein